MSVHSHETDVAFLRGIAQHADQKGWIDRLYYYILDEPKPSDPSQWQMIKDRATALHKADPRLRALVTTSIQNAKGFGITQCASPRKDPCLDLFTPTVRFMDNKPVGRTPGGEIPGGEDTVGNQRSKYGPEVWWYQACGSHGCGILGGGPNDPSAYHTGWPTFMIDLPALFSRVMQWQSFKYNIQGELYYDMVYAYGQRDPWVSQFDFAGNGDGTLYYPGTPAKIGGTKHIPIESIRLKMIREGMEDYEYMNLLAQMGEASFAQAQVANAVTNTYTWSRKPADFYAARENMAVKIAALIGPTPDPGPTPVPTPGHDPGPPPDPAPAPSDTAPTAVITSTPSDTDPLLVHFSSSDSHDADGPIASVAWDFGDGQSGTDPQMAHPYAQPGTYQVILTVTDEAGKSSTVSLALSITGLADMPVAQWSAQSADSPLLFAFDGSQSSAGAGSVVQYHWDFGDNTTATGAKVEHQYRTPGQYEVKLTVMDDKGKSATAAYALKAGAGDDPASPSSAPGGKGGGCGMIQKLGPTDYRQAIPYLLIFFAPFWRTVLRKVRSRSR
jgi:PKD repeat protein